MTSVASHSKSAVYTPAAARGFLAAAVGLLALLLAASLGPWRQGKADSPAGGPSDIYLYLGVIHRMRLGEGYYDAMASELVARGFPTQSVFNWRMPAPLTLNALLPDSSVSKCVLGILAALAAMVCFESVLRDYGKKTAILAGCALTGPLMLTVLGDIHTMPVVWAGVLITFSLGLKGIGYNTAGAAAGVSALFCRELAGPYCAVSCLSAIYQRRFREAQYWMLGMACFAVYFAWHYSMVQHHQPFDGVRQQGYWIQFGGLPFLVSLSQINAYLLLVPQWISAIALAASLIGLAGWRSEWGMRLTCTVGVYLALFSCVGYEYNQYWGILITPLLAIGAARCPLVLANWVDSAFASGTTTRTNGALVTSPIHGAQFGMSRQ